MPTTRSRSQPTLQYPRRKSSRAAAAKPQPVARAEPPPSGAALPLSPRKRLGAENGCNLPPGVLGSPPKQSRLRDPSPARGSRRLSFDENVPCRDAPSPVKPAAPSCPAEVPSSQKLGTPQRACTTPTAKGSPARSPFRCRQETPGSSPAGAQGERRPPVVRLFANDNSRFQQVKQALHTSLPERLLSRDRESAVIRSFLCERVKGRRPGSLYISGAPGTGKTACLTRILQDCREELQGAQCVFINCMTLRSSQAVFALVAERLGAAGGQSQPKDSDRRLEKLVTRPGPMVLLVLDEMDQLDSKAQDVLYTIFEWPWLASSRLCLIGIANALDLTDRILPRLQARPHCRPLLLNFPPYSRQELTAIVQDRLAQVSGEPVLDGVAVQFCARKVSAVSGDARKALDICRRAVEMVESDVRSQKASESKGAPRASLPQVSRVLSEVYGERMAGGEAECFPLQQKLLVCALLLQSQHGKSRELPLGKLHEVYSRLCRQRQVSAVAAGECLSLCTLLESRGVFGLKKAKEARLTKVSLKMQEKDVEHALKDKALLGSILAAGLP